MICNSYHLKKRHVLFAAGCLLFASEAVAQSNQQASTLPKSSHKLVTDTKNRICSDTAVALRNTIYTANRRIYLARGGAHQSLEVLSGIVGNAIKNKDDSSCLSRPAIETQSKSASQDRIYSIFSFLLSSVVNNSAQNYGRDSEYVTDQNTPLNKFSHILSSRISALEVRDAGLLFGLSFTHEKRQFLLVINHDPYSKHTLPLAQLTQHTLINALNKQVITNQNNPILQPAESFLFEQRAANSPEGTEPLL
ncbi:hypothetical protein ISG33_16470 [Glaciecola sp. MH2013]|uniref:hypothetical protein n=1 Tax=Glaciecola sp. MH2013 TaxID=2785524 RepID=UPI00189E7152|nr:hypothetical protein [Glaciecola sp. MH2013]MBF7074997.1 hypothetical protein [Glaciecola sp. MH2013]